MVGFAGSLPWDRSEKTYNVAATLTKLQGNHTIKFGGEWRHNRDFLLQTQDAGGSRGEFIFGAAGTGLLGDNPSVGNLANSFAAYLLDWPNQVRRDLRVLDPGHQAPGDVRVRARQVADPAEHHAGPRPPVGVLHAVRRPRRPGRPVELRRRHQHAARCRLRQHTRQPGREEATSRTSTRGRGSRGASTSRRSRAPATAPARSRSPTTASPSTIR